MKTIKYFLISILGILFFSGTSAFAEQTDTPSAAGFSVMKLDPEVPQVDPASSFYDLLVKPGDELMIQAQLTNSSEKDSAFNTQAFTASTNNNGEISYTKEPAKKELDQSLTIPFSSIAEVVEQNPLLIPAGAKKTVSLKIHVPENAEEGVILGSWYFDKAADDENKKAKTGVNIENRFAYALAVKLTVAKEVSDPHLNLLTIKPDLNNYHKVINAKIQNDRRAVTTNLSFQGEVTKKGSKKVLYRSDSADKIMAPNSHFDFSIFLKEGQLKAGDYTLHLNAKTKDPKWQEKNWKWDQDFTVKAAAAEKLNKNSLNDPKPKPNYLLYLLIGIFCILLVILLVLLIKKPRKKNN